MCRAPLPLALAATLLVLPTVALANGCIVVRPTAPLVFDLGDAHSAEPTRWEYAVSYRYLYSDRHFRGSHEEPHRQELETDVRNSVHTFDHTLTWQMDERWRFSASLPIQRASRSSLYEHDRVNRHSMHANGIGDLRLMAYRNMLLPEPGKPARGLTLGLGIKLPTGKTDVKDTAFRPGGPERRNVDQSIQPGDGGTGLIVEMQAYRSFLSERNFAFFSASYLINPRETNGVITHRSAPGEEVMSVPDTYQVRTGVARVFSPDKGVTGDLALRLEGVPAEDLVGGSDGFRRPGYALYLEPGVSVERSAHRFSFSLPVAIERNRVKSVADRRNGRHGDAAFADYLLQASYSYRW